MCMRGHIAVAVTAMLAGTFGCGEVGDATKLLDGLVAGVSEADQQRSESREMPDRAVEDRDMAREEIDREGARRGEEADEHAGLTRDDCEALGVRLRELVARGELTAEEARERYDAACGGRDDRGRGDARPDWDAIKKRIESAVERGEMTREEADALYAEIRRRMARESE
jgi:polyhydroxyalkanoate synthesis regulator phasin